MSSASVAPPTEADSSAKATGVMVCFSTMPDLATAEKIARALVEESLVACVNLVPRVRSIYRWNGAVCDEEEVLLIIKTTHARREDLRARLLELHPYEVPELICAEVLFGHEPYLDWVRDSTR